MWSFKELRETRKELISKGGGEGSCLRKRAKLERSLISKVDGKGSPHWFHFYFKVYRVPSRGCELFF